jgi:hypothetical protein
MSAAEDIREHFIMGRLTYNQALAALTIAGEEPEALGYVHIARSPLLGARGAQRDLGHDDVTRVDHRRVS